MSYLQIIKAFFSHFYVRINETRVLDAAAAIAYYAIFSFFPLILFLIAFNSSFLQSPEVQGQILKFTENYLPGSQSIVEANIHHLIHSSRAVGIVGTIILLWSSSLVFAGFSQNINLAWTNSESRHFLTERLIGLMMIGIIIIFLIVSLIINALTDILPTFFPAYMGGIFAEMSRATHILIDYLPLVTMFALFIILYKYIPSVKVYWREAITGAIFAVIAIELTKAVFVWYLSLGAGRYQLIYGSLGALVGFLLWVYISSCIVLIGGHVCACIAHITIMNRNYKQETDEEAVASPS